jgi:eukaryotic-like serine/threonine-protein kinase
MTQFLRRRWPIAVVLCLLLCVAALPLAGAGDEPAKDEITNSIGMKLKLIPAGKFLMGSPKDEKGRYDDEGPQHTVEITRPFYLGVYPVTKGQFAAFVKDAGYQTEAEQAGEKQTWQNPGFEKYDQSDDDPVTLVSWNDAVKYCGWLSKKEKKTYQLPTEAQWEYACRAGTTTAYSFGDDPKDFGDYAWYINNSGDHTHPVGGKKPNPWGLYDMYGNVFQRCQDGYGPYPSADSKDPQYTNKTDDRVERGGSWNGIPGQCRSAFRLHGAPGNRYNIIGCRVCLCQD